MQTSNRIHLLPKEITQQLLALRLRCGHGPARSTRHHTIHRHGSAYPAAVCPQASQASSFNSRGVAAARSSHARPSLPPRFMLADASGIHTRSASHAPITLPARTLSTRVARRSSGGFWVVCVVAGLTLAASRAVPSTPSRPAAISNSGREYHPRCIASGELRALETHG
ncbi:hypothetical protein ACCO45_004407 [Purpureocillium lilacinum]|uniref:Uncharacterized protein n=1 Tax=Purpureocillium lilacinum TaxID=33203 RepID=A0ACC4E2M6_PURLI